MRLWEFIIVYVVVKKVNLLKKNNNIQVYKSQQTLLNIKIL